MSYEFEFNVAMKTISTLEERLSHLSAVNEKLVDAAKKVVAHYEFVHRGMPVSTGVYLIGKLEEAVNLADEMGEGK